MDINGFLQSTCQETVVFRYLEMLAERTAAPISGRQPAVLGALRWVPVGCSVVWLIWRCVSLWGRVAMSRRTE